MADYVIVKQDGEFHTQFWAEQDKKLKGKMVEIEHIHQLDPYGMMLASLGSCTAIVLNTFAQYHHLHLDEVEIHLKYNRNYEKDCETCEETENYTEEIAEDLKLSGALNQEEKKAYANRSQEKDIYSL